MLKIGDFARPQQRAGEDAALLRRARVVHPAHVDDFTGYRYYAAEVTHEQLRGMLVLKRAEVEIG
jgi:hypothetical protein